MTTSGLALSLADHPSSLRTGGILRRTEQEETAADVLVVGGGPAATWAAVAAVEAGALVILVDKGYVGTSGATAPANTGTW